MFVGTFQLLIGTNSKPYTTMGRPFLSILIGEIPYENQSRGTFKKFSAKVPNFKNRSNTFLVTPKISAEGLLLSPKKSVRSTIL